MPQRRKCPNLNREYFSCKKACFSSEKACFHWECWLGEYPPSGQVYSREYRCVPTWLGCTVGRSPLQWTSASSPTAEPYQHAHIGSSFLRCQWVPEQATWQRGLLDVWQHHNDILHQSGRHWVRSFKVTRLTIRLLKFCDWKRIVLIPVHIPGRCSVQANSLSRLGEILSLSWLGE